MEIRRWHLTWVVELWVIYRIKTWTFDAVIFFSSWRVKTRFERILISIYCTVFNIIRNKVGNCRQFDDKTLFGNESNSHPKIAFSLNFSHWNHNLWPVHVQFSVLVKLNGLRKKLKYDHQKSRNWCVALVWHDQFAVVTAQPRHGTWSFITSLPVKRIFLVQRRNRHTAPSNSFTSNIYSQHFSPESNSSIKGRKLYGSA